MTQEEYQDYLGSAHWREYRGQIYQRANGTCERCGLLPPCAVHHNRYDRLGHEADTDCQALCKQCHDYQHSRGVDPKQALDGSLSWLFT